MRTRILGVLVAGLLMALVLPWIVPAVATAEVVLTPSKDTTIYEGETDNSNGAGSQIFVGRTTGDVDPPARNRRALVRFDLSVIPPGATVTGVTLELTETRTPPDAITPVVSLHRLRVDFGEGATNGASAGLSEGDGAPAISPDATWIHRITPTTAWAAEGAQAGTDFVAAASGSDSDGTIGTTPGMVADVQAWVDNSSSNFGWILIGDEATNGSVRGYGSRDHTTTSARPQLTVAYQTPPDLTVVKSDSKDPVLPGETFSYTIGVANNGESTAANVEGVDALPGGVEFVSATGTGWTCTETTTDAIVTCTRSQLAGGTNAPDITIVVTAPLGATTLTNSVSVATSSTESNTGNNSDQETTTINIPLSVDAGADVSGEEGTPIVIEGSASDFDGDPLTLSWTVTPGVDVDAGATCVLSDPSAASTEVTCTDDGTYTATLTADDGVNSPVSDSALVTVTNLPPAVTIDNPNDGSVTSPGSTTVVIASLTDPGTNDTHTCEIDWGDAATEAGTVSETDGLGTCTGSHVYDSSGTYTLRVLVTDDEGAVGSDEISIIVNAPPIVDAGPDLSGDEGTLITLQGSASDAEGDPITVNWTVDTSDKAVNPGKGECQVVSPGSLTTSVTCNDDGVYQATLTVDDGLHPPVQATAFLSLANVAPTVTVETPAEGGIFSPGTVVDLSASFTDPGTNDTHAGSSKSTGNCEIDWGDGITDIGVVSEADGAGTCTGVHAYEATGTPTITVTVTDDDGDAGTATSTIEVVELSLPEGTDGSVTTDADGNTEVTVTDDSGTVGTVELPPGTETTSDTVEIRTTTQGQNSALEINGVSSPYPPGKSVTLRSNPGANFACIADSSNAVLVEGLPRCGSTDTSISQVVLACDGEARDFSGFPEDPSSRTYTCTKFTEDGTTFMRVDGLAFSMVLDGADPDGVIDAEDNCPFFANLGQEDADTDGLGDLCDPNAFLPDVVTPAVDTAGQEGDELTASGAFSDQDGDQLTITKSSGKGTVTDNGDGTWSWSFTPPDNGSGPVVVEVNDGEHVVSDSFDWSVSNVAPAVDDIIAPVDPVEVGTEIAASASFTDPGILDTHSAIWAWGDGTTSQGVMDGAAGTVSGTHAYTEPGVYTLTLTVTDDDGGSDEAVFEFVVVYDPEGGFVTGGGWIKSPEGAYILDPTLTGKANFGFVSKYKKGATTPTGRTEFQFRAGGLEFHSSEYEWLIISGPKAQFKGSGTINGAGDYGFLLTANDGQVNGGGGVDRFRIKIWDKTTGDVIYDNQPGEADDANAATELGGGSIVIHKG